MDEINTTALASSQQGPVEGTSELRKPHEMIVMLPRSKRVTLTGRKIYNALLHVAQSRLAAMGAMPQADYMFEAPLPAILRTSGSDGEDRTAAKRYLREMRGLEVDWESTAPGNGVKWRGFSMLSEVVIEVRAGVNWVSWSYPPTIMSALREPTRWARIDLEILACLGTYASAALYEICARYRDNPSGVTSRKPVEWWANALSPSTSGNERRAWRKFKNERIKDAIEEINRETDVEIDLIEHKQGRSVVEVQFSVRRKRVVQSGRNTATIVDAHLVLRAESLGIPERKLEALIREFDESRVREMVDVIERRAANSSLRGIENAHSYLRSLLRNGDSPEPTVNATQAETVAPTPVMASREPVQERARPENRWLSERIACIKDEIRHLSAEHRAIFVDLALREMSSRGLLTAVVKRRAEQGDVLHDLLGSMVVRCYGLHKYGEGWDKPADASSP